MTIYAYARVSTKEQNLSRQEEAFKEFHIKKGNLFSDKQSGKDFERDNYQKLIRRLKEGDLLIIKSIDRLGRNYEMILEEWHRITKIIRADILVLDMPLLDTRDKGNTLTGRLISDIVLQLLSYVAESERNNIKQRQKEGIKLAKEKGISFGRPKKEYPSSIIEAIKAYKSKQKSLKDVLQETGFKKSNFYYHLKQIN